MKVPVYITRYGDRKLTDHIVMAEEVGPCTGEEGGDAEGIRYCEQITVPFFEKGVGITQTYHQKSKKKLIAENARLAQSNRMVVTTKNCRLH